MAVERVDVAVIGGGIVGLAAVDALRERGAQVIGLERGRPGEGQSAGRARVFRHLHGDPDLIRLAVGAAAGWRGWERRFSRPLLGGGGVLRLGAERVELDRLRAAGVRATMPPPEAAAEHLPILAPAAAPLLLDAEGGALEARSAVEALTEASGTSLRTADVQTIGHTHDGGVRLETSAGSLACRRCLVCAGPGTDRLVRPLGLEPRQERRAHLRLAFGVRDPRAEPLAAWTDRSGEFGELAYGVPEGPGRYAVGLAALAAYPAVAGDADGVPPETDLSAARERLLAYVRRAFPGLDPDPVDAVLRLTTALRGRDEDAFGLWRRDGVLAFAGANLFKFAPRLGELLAAATLEDAEHPLLTGAVARRPRA